MVELGGTTLSSTSATKANHPSKRLQDLMIESSYDSHHSHNHLSHPHVIYDPSAKKRRPSDAEDDRRENTSTNTTGIITSLGSSPISLILPNSSLSSTSTASATTTTTTSNLSRLGAHSTNTNQHSLYLRSSAQTNDEDEDDNGTFSREPSVGDILQDNGTHLDLLGHHNNDDDEGEEDVDIEESLKPTNFLHHDNGDDNGVTFYPRSRTESTYLRPEELPPTKDEHCAKCIEKAIVTVKEVLEDEVRTAKGLLEPPKMTLLRALFDVPKATDDYKSIARWVMTLFKANNKLMYLMQIAIRQEVHRTIKEVLFREDTMVCILASSFLKSAGGLYLQKILGPIISKMSQSRKSYEIDLHKPGGRKENEKRVRHLVKALLDRIFDSSKDCPPNVKEFLFYMRSEIRDVHNLEQAEITVRSFFFLRFVCPVIVNPRENGAITTCPTEEAKRGLCIAARIIQTLANDGACDSNKPHLLKINKLIEDNRSKVKKFIDGLSNKLVLSKETIEDTTTASLGSKLAVEELRKYMTHKINCIPANPTPEELVKYQSVLTLRRAIQACAHNNHLTRSASTPSNSPSQYRNPLSLLASSPIDKRRSSIDVFL